MMRSMFSGISGLSTHQLKMDVIGNNIANVNTVGFKGGRVTFKEVYSQTIKGASSPQLGRGGTNPNQIGLGVGVAAMDTMHSRSPVERTDNPTDLAIDGEGFFIVSDDPNFLNRSFTRAGDFRLDEAGNLVTPGGMRVLGYGVRNVEVDGTVVYENILQGMVISRAQMVEASQTSMGSIEGNLDASGSLPDAGPPAVPGFTKIHEFEVFDGLGGRHKIRLAFEKTNVNEWELTANYVNLDGTLTAFAGSETLTFLDGKLTPPPGDIEFGIGGGTGDFDGIPALPNGATAFSFNINLDKMTQFVGESKLENTNFNGYPIGSLADFEIGPSGEIMGIFDNGQNKIIGRLALANFRNPPGLIKTSNNLYRTSPNSGDPIVGYPGSGGLGQIAPGALEMSNVDLSREFTEMIRTQRGFQANSRIITTSDEMLQELVNLKR